jgi:hypothetical protein
MRIRSLFVSAWEAEENNESDARIVCVLLVTALRFEACTLDMVYSWRCQILIAAGMKMTAFWAYCAM